MRQLTICSTFFFVLGTFMLTLVVLMNPMLHDTIDKSVQDIVPTRITISRQLNPTKIEMKTSTRRRITDTASSSKKTTVYNYIRNNIFATTVGDMAMSAGHKDPTSPMHKAMLLMGCYGSPWSSGMVNTTIGHFLEAPFLTTIVDEPNRAFMLNFMLQAMDDHYTMRTSMEGGASVHDQSACSCLRDFASPSFMRTEQKPAESTEYSCSSKVTYEHDSCSMQNALDYSLDGKDGVGNATAPEILNMILATPMGNNDLRQRNRVDPILWEVNAYMMSLKKEPNYMTMQLQTKPHLRAFVEAYCSEVGFGNSLETMLQTNSNAPTKKKEVTYMVELVPDPHEDAEPTDKVYQMTIPGSTPQIRPVLALKEGYTYKFDQSHPSNANAYLEFDQNSDPNVRDKWGTPNAFYNRETYGKITTIVMTPAAYRSLQGAVVIYHDENNIKHGRGVEFVGNSITQDTTPATTDDEMVYLEQIANDPDLSESFEMQISRRCPLLWNGDEYESSHDTHSHHLILHQNLTVNTVLEQMQKWSSSMATYNKLRTPEIDNMQTTRQKEYSASASYPRRLTTDSFRTYIEKYKAAFEVCARVGVPRYTTQITGFTNAMHWYAAGELLLLLAATLSYFWSWVIHREKLSTEVVVADDKVGMFYRALYFADDLIAMIFSMIAPILLWVLAVWRLIVFTREELEENYDSVNNTYGEFMTGFLAVWYLLYIILLLVIVYLFYRTASKFSLGSMRSLLMGYKQVSDEDTAYSHKNFRDDFVKSPLAQLNGGMLIAQIAMDLPVIVGLTLLGISTTMMRGVGDYNLILTVAIFFTAIGLTNHISNVLRLMHLYVQPRQREFTKTDGEKHIEAIKYNRVLIGVLIAVMLYTFIQLAGMDSFQGESYGAAHQFIFAILAFAILTFGDLSLELFCIFPRQFANKHDYFYNAVFNKARHTGWIILISIFILHCHQMTVLCRRREPMNSRIDVCEWFP